MHLAAVPEAHLDLGRVHIHVHPRRIQRDEQGVDRLAVAVQHVFVGAAGGVGDGFVAHIAAVHISELPVVARARGIGHASESPDAQTLAFVFDGLSAGRGPLHRDRLRNEVFTEHIAQPLAQRGHAAAGHGAPLRMQFALVPDGKTHIGPGQGVAAHRLHAMGQLGGVGFQELAARGRGEKQLAHLHRGARRAGGGLQFTAAAVEQPAVGLFVGVHPGEQRNLGDGADGGQRLAPKTHGADRFQIAQAGDLAGGVALQGGGQLGAQNAAAVVLHADQAHAAGQQAQGDLGGARVQGVVHQLAHDRGGPLHDFAGGDLTDQLVGQFKNGAAWGGRCKGGGHGEIVGFKSR